MIRLRIVEKRFIIDLGPNVALTKLPIEQHLIIISRLLSTFDFIATNASVTAPLGRSRGNKDIKQLSRSYLISIQNNMSGIGVAILSSSSGKH